jgi:hypothetical protein
MAKSIYRPQSESTKEPAMNWDRELTRLRSEQTSRVMPVVAALLDFWDAMPNDEKDLVLTNPRLACLLDELDAAMEGAGLPKREMAHPDLAKSARRKLADLCGDMHSFATNMRRDDSDARDCTLSPYADALDQFAAVIRKLIG